MVSESDPTFCLQRVQNLHVDSPASLPEVHFFGADHTLSSYRLAFNANLGRWQQHRSVRHNLEDVLNVTFPKPASQGGTAEEDCSAECAICYTYDLDGVTPDTACDNCSKLYHRDCLAEWLRSIPTTHQSFRRLFGTAQPFVLAAQNRLTVPCILIAYYYPMPSMN